MSTLEYDTINQFSGAIAQKKKEHFIYTNCTTPLHSKCWWTELRQAVSFYS